MPRPKGLFQVGVSIIVAPLLMTLLGIGVWATLGRPPAKEFLITYGDLLASATLVVVTSVYVALVYRQVAVIEHQHQLMHGANLRVSVIELVSPDGPPEHRIEETYKLAQVWWQQNHPKSDIAPDKGKYDVIRIRNLGPASARGIQIVITVRKQKVHFAGCSKDEIECGKELEVSLWPSQLSPADQVDVTLQWSDDTGERHRIHTRRDRIV